MASVPVSDDVAAWLLDSDPALRWQVERDLLRAPADVWQATRARIATEGFGARLLALQDEAGTWAGGAFFPAGFDFDGPEAQPGAGQPWTATTWSLNTLREWGLDPAVLRERDTAGLIAANARWEYDDLPYWGGEVDACINGFTLANGLWLGADVDGVADWFVAHQMAEGGWNCEWVEGSTRASVRSTLNSLKGLLAYEEATGGTDAVREAQRRAEEYLLERRLIHRLTTGEPVADWVFRLAYPFRAFYDVLTATDYFRAASLLRDTPPDPRVAEAVELVRSQRQPDGTWLQARRHPGRVWFEVDVDAGQPSKWLTFHAARVLGWWDDSVHGSC
ncbi:squalene cyclase [Promicromonospora kroppenstedtii]|uniref:Squalene cyclase n=1 Tax=Promicromonospora kroppenstedtii TaxID=440482 RepID=A0ABW7XGH6_9MICO